ncbi:MAG: tRNA 4-thiouridine(8) synthase ThiI [Candidatus ainarchaeum sp.]|nr:tRNA 4-thiouridine(8) synthase ThiI [Candidatus ainarchaeum sp.]MDD3976347.1 tRNA 4-thiouridine(8) synthase ThiI [Candidatus ainarchaeum sp.]
MQRYLVIHYNEIGLKGKNRPFFEKKLEYNINRLLFKDLDKIQRRYGLIYCKLKDSFVLDNYLFFLENFPGISKSYLSVVANYDVEDIKEKALFLINEKLLHSNFISFKINSKRSFKSFKYTSLDLNIIIGKYIEEKTNLCADLKNPQIILKIEVGEKEIFISLDEIKGIGGLPIGTTGKVISSLSGGIDSPVASFEVLKRGCEVIFVHIYNNTLVKGEIINKIKKIVFQLNNFQQKSKLYIVPFSEIQKNIISFIPCDYRMIIYRRYMLKLMEHIALKENAKAIVTGDSLGQVASQTLDNLGNIFSSINMPIISPLITFNKDEIVKISKKIKTFEISIIPYPDCCSFMISNHPQTKARLEDILKFEDIIKSKEALLISNAISSSEVFVF